MPIENISLFEKYLKGARPLISVVMLTEIISKWFSEAPLEQWMTLGGILVVLAIIRVVAVQWSPTRGETAPEWTPTPKTH